MATATSRLLGGITVTAVLYYVVAAAVMHLVQPELHPLHTFMSEYVLGPRGWLMTGTFFAWALGLAATAVVLRRVGGLHRTGRAGLLLLWPGALGVAAAGIFPTDPVDPPVTTTGTLHAALGALGLLFLCGALPLLSLELRRHERWRSLAPALLALAAGFAGGILSIVFVIGSGPYCGLAQRVGIGSSLAWMTLVGMRSGSVDEAWAAHRDEPVATRGTPNGG